MYEYTCDIKGNTHDSWLDKLLTDMTVYLGLCDTNDVFCTSAECV